ncbi:MAG: endonuclease domain-containing protein, partial [Hyphomicrobium sp.]
MRPGRNELARQLRRNQTDAEKVLWSRLRDRQIGGWKFRRQVPFGTYVLDFYCADAKLVIEVDGGQHAEERKSHDEIRSAFLGSEGVCVVRYWNGDVLKNIDGVIEAIYLELGQRPAPSPGAKRAGLSPEGRGEIEQAQSEPDKQMTTANAADTSSPASADDSSAPASADDSSAPASADDSSARVSADDS